MLLTAIKILKLIYKGHLYDMRTYDLNIIFMKLHQLFWIILTWKTFFISANGIGDFKHIDAKCWW